MTRRRLLLFAAAACLLVAVPFLVRWVTTPKPGVTLENFRRLDRGMTLQEIETVLGREGVKGHPFSERMRSETGGRFWQSKDGAVIWIFVDEVRGLDTYGVFHWPDRTFEEMAYVPDRLSLKIRRWLGL